MCTAELSFGKSFMVWTFIWKHLQKWVYCDTAVSTYVCAWQFSCAKLVSHIRSFCFVVINHSMDDNQFPQILFINFDKAMFILSCTYVWCNNKGIQIGCKKLQGIHCNWVVNHESHKSLRYMVLLWLL